MFCVCTRTRVFKIRFCQMPDVWSVCQQFYLLISHYLYIFPSSWLQFHFIFCVSSSWFPPRKIGDYQLVLWVRGFVWFFSKISSKLTPYVKTQISSACSNSITVHITMKISKIRLMQMQHRTCWSHCLSYVKYLITNCTTKPTWYSCCIDITHVRPKSFPSPGYK